MADEKFTENLMRAVVAELHFLNCLTAARRCSAAAIFHWAKRRKRHCIK